MPDSPSQPAPFWRLALVLWLLGLGGAILILPYALALQGAALAAAAARTHLTVGQLVLISTAQTAFLLLVAVLAGLWTSRKIGLAIPLLSAWLTRRPVPAGTGRTLLLAFAIGLAVGLVLVGLDCFVFTPMPSIAGLVKAAGSEGARPNAWQGLLASFYGGIDEEMLMRLGVMSVLALALRTVLRRRDVALPSGVFWTANILTAILFGLGHLPATAALAPLTTALVVRAIVLNGLAGIVFGALFRRYGLEWAMVSHFGADIILHVALG